MDAVADEGYSQARRAEILRRIEELKPWYHKIDLGDGIVTPGNNYERSWVRVREVLALIDYEGKHVLDLGSWDGMWAFEAEKLGAASVVATDARTNGLRNLMFAAEVLRSKVIPFYNVPVQELEQRLNVVGLDRKFDIVQHLGLLYHLRDPLLSLAQCRRVIAPGGFLILETMFINDEHESYMLFGGLEGEEHFGHVSDVWAPSKRCLREMLIRSFFEPVFETNWRIVANRNLSVLGHVRSLGRITMVARPSDTGHIADRRKVFGSQ